MNKLLEFQQGPVLDEFKHHHRLEQEKLKIDKIIHSEFRLHPKPQNKFASHPQRICSDSDTSVGNTPRHCSSSSSQCDLELKRSLEENTLKIKNSRKKLHKKLERVPKHPTELKLHIGDSAATLRSRNETSDEESDEDEYGDGDKNALPKKSSIVYPSRKPSVVKTTNTQVQQVQMQKVTLTDSMFEKKFKIFVEKSLHVISDIRSLMDKGIDPPDGDEDISRRHLRVKEFSNRFSRNYLYPIIRQLEDLNKLRPTNSSLNQKLLSAYQVILNGLQAYQNHFPSSIGDCSSDKLKLLLRHLLELCEFHAKIFRDKDDDSDYYIDFITAFKLNAELTLQKIGDFTAPSSESVLKSTATRISLANKKPMLSKKNNQKSILAERLSMYATSASFRRDTMWKKAAENLAKRKFNVKSRYKTAVFRHRPPIEKDQQIMEYKNKLFPRRTAGLVRKTPIEMPIDEDNITTMVEMDNRKGRELADCETRENGTTEEDRASHQDMVVRLLQLVLNAATATGVDPSGGGDDGPAAPLPPMGGSLTDVHTLRKIVDELTRAASKTNGQELELRVSTSTIKEGIDLVDEKIGGIKKRKEPKVTVTGVKNAKLICITDENSIDEPIEEVLDIPCANTDENHDSDHKVALETKEEARKKKDECNSNDQIQKPAKANVKMKRSVKKSRILKMLPKDYALDIIQYKLDFHKYCKGNPMYRRTENVVPWKLVGKISDDLLDLSLLGVAKEIELNDVIDHIYQSELQM